jgi:hypothetical protein
LTEKLTERIAELERENNFLKSKLRAAGLMMPEVASPDDSELDQLLHITGQYCHHLIPRTAEEVPLHRERVQRALLYLAFTRRGTKASPYSTTSFVDECNSFLKRFGLAGDVGLRSFLAAAVMSDISTNLAEYPHGTDIALLPGTTSQAQSNWRAVLARGRPAPSLEGKRAPPQPVQLNITGGWR